MGSRSRTASVERLEAPSLYALSAAGLGIGGKSVL